MSNERKDQGGLIAVPVFLTVLTIVLVIWYVVQDGRGGTTAPTTPSAAATGR